MEDLNDQHKHEHKQLYEVHVHVHSEGNEKLDQIVKTLSSLNIKINKMAITLQEALAKSKELSDKVDVLQATIDTEQADIKALVDNNAQVVIDLKSQIAALQAIIDANPGIDLQPLMDSMNDTIAKIDAASADVASTV